MDTLLRLQKTELAIEHMKDRQAQIPKQKQKFEIHKQRLAAELEESEQRYKRLQIEQREAEVDIEQKQELIRKYDGQLLAVKKNEEYQALLHEIEMLKKQIGVKEERIIAIMLEIDEAKDHLEEDRKRIAAEVEGLDNECTQVDEELAATMAERQRLEAEREPLLEEIDRALLAQYHRIRKSKKRGPAVVPLRGESCSGCNMMVPPQIVNELLAGDKVHSCKHCGRLLYHPENLTPEPAEIVGNEA